MSMFKLKKHIMFDKLFAYTNINSKPRESINVNLLILRVFGLWFPEEEQWTWRSKKYLLYAIVVQMIFYILYVSTETFAMAFSFSTGDIVDVTDASYLMLTHYAQAFKVIQFYRFQMRMVRFLNELDSEIFAPKNETQRRILRRGMRRATHDSVILLSGGVITCFLWAIFPFIESKEGDAYYRLPLSGWFPFDVRHGWKFAVAFTYQMFGATINALTNISLDTVATGIFVQVCCQLDMLKDSLEHMKDNAMESIYKNKQYNKENTDNTEKQPPELEITDEQLEKEMEKVFIKCVKHHYAIMEYAKEIEGIFNMCFLAQFSASILIICVTMFEATLIPIQSLRFFSIWCYQFCIVFELLLYSWHGNEMMLKSLGLAEAAYKSEWYKFSPKFSKNIVLIMARSKRPIVVTAGKFFALSLSTFTGVLRLSWSYFAVLRSMNDE